MEPELWAVFAAVALPFAAAPAVPLLRRLVGEKLGYFGAVIAAVSFALLATQVGREGTVSLPWIPSLDVAVTLYVDGWALVFALLASGIGVLIFAYSTAYMVGKPNLGLFYATLLAFMGSILGVALAGDLILLFVFWELTSVCSFVLIGYHTDEDESRYSARTAMVVTVGGGLCLLVAILALAFAGGTAEGSATAVFDIATLLSEGDSVGTALEDAGLFVPALVLVAVAAGAKSAQVPFHFWLPRAMVAPTPVSAFLHSATMVKVGVYVVGRFRPVFYGPEWTLVFATLGLLTMTVGALLAVISSDLKELLAYSTASHLGLMVAAFGFRTHYGAEAGVFHLLNHALFKAPLFLVAGIVAHKAGTRYIDDLSGLRRDLPLTAAVALVTALSMAGIPPFSGFYSKEILFEATWATAETVGGVAWLYPATAVSASVFTVVYSLRFLGVFFGEREAEASVGTPSPLLVVPAAVLAGAVAVVSVAPDAVVEPLVQDAAVATAAGRETVDVHGGIPTALSGPVLMTVVALAVGFVAYARASAVRRGIEVVHDKARYAHPNVLYDKAMNAVGDAGTRTDAVVHNGLVRTYATWVLTAGCSLVLLGYTVASVTVPRPDLATLGTPPAIVLVLAVAAVATVAVVRATSHVTGVLTLGILGFMVAIFYILASAPDLALTQLVVETLLLVVFLLVIEELPAFYSDVEAGVVLRDAALSFAVGATAFVSVLVAAPSEGDALTETARFYVDNAVPDGGGTNVVNVVLTDFRAFDTLGEAAVVLIATLSVLVLLMMRSRGERR